MTRILNLCAALLLGLGAAVSQAASYAGSEFEIELIVFSRDKGMERARETWPAAPRLHYSPQWVDFQTPSAGDPSLPALPPAATRLDNKVAALSRSGEYKVLFHKAWRQVLQEKRRAPAVLISGGNDFRGHRELEGSVTISVSRYLHLSTDLWFSQFGSGDSGIALPARPQLARDEPLDLLAAERAGAANESIVDAVLDANLVRAEHVAVLQEERRLRSGELHYIDHPQLGVLVEIRTVEGDTAGE